MFCEGCPLAVLAESFTGFEVSVKLQDLDTLQYLIMQTLFRKESACVDNCSFFGFVRDYIEDELDKICED